VVHGQNGATNHVGDIFEGRDDIIHFADLIAGQCRAAERVQHDQTDWFTKIFRCLCR
jgi:hypothetical protein